MTAAPYFTTSTQPAPAVYSTVARNNFHSLSDILHYHPHFYIFPHPQDYYNNKKTFGHTWSERAKKR